MARLFNGTTDHLVHNAAVVTAPPFTVCFWLWQSTSDANDGKYLWSAADSASSTSYFAITGGGSLAGTSSGQMAAIQRSNVNVIFSTANTIIAGSWNHVAMRISGSNRDIILNGDLAQRGANAAGALNPSGVNSMAWGRLNRNGTTLNSTGRIAEGAAWDVALSDDEIVSLSRGELATNIRRDSLKGYWPMHADVLGEEPGELGQYPMTVNGTTRAEHAPIVVEFESIADLPYFDGFVARPIRFSPLSSPIIRGVA